MNEEWLLPLTSNVVIRKRGNGETAFFMLFNVTFERVSPDKASRADGTGKIRFANCLVQQHFSFGLRLLSFGFRFRSDLRFAFILQWGFQLFGQLVLLLGVDLQSVPLVDMTRQNSLRF